MSEMIRIGSRRSDLALVQSRHVRDVIETRGGVSCEIVEMDTRGDRDRTSALPAIGGKGLFTKELEDRLLSGEIDIAVHSLKDLPGELPDGLTLGAVSEREDPRDALVCATDTLATLAPGARVGTGSVRRAAQLAAVRADVSPCPIRGNVPTRIRKLDEGDYDAIILAAAGLRRLGLAGRVAEVFEPDTFVPAPGQGALGIECRAGDARILDLLARTIAHEPTSVCCRAERVIQMRLAAGCSAPVGIHASLHGAAVRIIAFAAGATGTRMLKETIEGPRERALNLADDLADRLVESGVNELLESARREER